MNRVTLNAQMAAGQIREVIEDGKRWIVAPAAILIQGVLNGSKGALFYSDDENKRTAHLWDRVPLTVNHPFDPINNAPLDAWDDGVVERQHIGETRNPIWNGKTRLEAWFDADATRAKAPEVYQKLMKRQQIALSTGLFTKNYPINGTYNGIRYDAEARDHKPDHLAVLPNMRGACHLTDGCGIGVTNAASDSLLALNADDDVTWVTMGGAHIPVKGGKFLAGPFKGKSVEDEEDRRDEAERRTAERGRAEDAIKATDEKLDKSKGAHDKAKAKIAEKHKPGDTYDHPEYGRVRVTKDGGIEPARNANPEGINQYTSGGGTPDEAVAQLKEMHEKNDPENWSYESIDKLTAAMSTMPPDALKQAVTSIYGEKRDYMTKGSRPKIIEKVKQDLKERLASHVQIAQIDSIVPTGNSLWDKFWAFITNTPKHPSTGKFHPQKDMLHAHAEKTFQELTGTTKKNLKESVKDEEDLVTKYTRFAASARQLGDVDAAEEWERIIKEEKEHIEALSTENAWSDEMRDKKTGWVKNWQNQYGSGGSKESDAASEADDEPADSDSADDSSSRDDESSEDEEGEMAATGGGMRPRSSRRTRNNQQQGDTTVAKKLTEQERKVIVDGLITNCSCAKANVWEESDRAALNVLPDSKLQKLKDQRDLAVKNEFPPVAEEEEEEEEEEEVEPTESEKRMKGKKTPAANRARTQAPALTPSTLVGVMNTLNKVNVLTSHIADPAKKQEMVANLLTKSDADLDIMIELSAGTRSIPQQGLATNMRITPVVPVFGGGGNDNQTTDNAAEDQSDTLTLNGIDWQQIAKERGTLPAGR